MGLDMMLYSYEFGKKESTEIGYWRKFNALHNYIVTEIGHNPKSNCEEIELLESDIKTILDKCYRIKKILDAAEKVNYSNSNGFETWVYKKEVSEEVTAILAPKSGFFWGDTEIDSFYYNNIVHTIEVFEKALVLAKRGDTIKYDSWW